MADFLPLLAVGLLGVSLGCDGAKSPESQFVEVRRPLSVAAGDTSVLGAIDEPQPPGFTSSTEEEKKNSDNLNRTALYPPGNRRVVTLLLLDSEGKLNSRFEHVDDTASLYLLNGFAFVPVVGPHGEKLSQRYVQHPAQWSYLPEGKPVPRVTRYDDEGGVLYTAPVPGSAEDLVVPFDTLYKGVPLPLPTGARGVKVISRRDRDWGAFLVALDKEWYLSRNRALKDSPGARWKSVFDRTVPDGTVSLGERADGTCDVFAVQPTGGAKEFPTVPTMTTCTIAAAAVTGKLVVLAEATAVDDKVRAKTNADKAYAQFVAAAQARRNQDDADAKRYYLEFVAAKDYYAACRQGERMAPSTYVDVVVARMSKADYSAIESLCAQKTVLFGAPREKLWAELDKRGIAVKAPPEAPRPPPAASPASAADPGAHDRYMKSVHDYVYGSGKASTCPFADRSLCR